MQREPAEMPDLRIPKDVAEKIGAAGAGSILDNIQKQQQADGQRLKVNAKSTRERKRRLGRPRLSLIDEKHRFILGNGASWTWRRSRLSAIGAALGITKKTTQVIFIEPATSELRRLSRAVQGKGYIGWFALNPQAVTAIRVVLRNWIRGVMREAAN